MRLREKYQFTSTNFPFAEISSVVALSKKYSHLKANILIAIFIWEEKVKCFVLCIFGNFKISEFTSVV